MNSNCHLMCTSKVHIFFFLFWIRHIMLGGTVIVDFIYDADLQLWKTWGPINKYVQSNCFSFCHTLSSKEFRYSREGMEKLQKKQ